MRLIFASLIVTHTVSVPEILWTTFTLAGLILSALLLRRAVIDLFFIRAEGLNHYREFSANTTILTFMMLALIQLCYVVSGVIAMLVPTPDDSVTPTTYGLTAVFLFSSAAFDLLALMINRRKGDLIEMIKEELDERTDP